MPIIAKIGRSSPRVRTIMGIFYVLLITGALVVLYPFLLLLSHSVASETDQYDHTIIPRYLHNDTALYQKHVADKYGHRFIKNYNRRYGTIYKAYNQIPKEQTPNKTYVDVWSDFKDNRIPHSMKQAAFSFELHRKFTSPVNRIFRKYTLSKYGDLNAINKHSNQHYTSIQDLSIFHEDFLNNNWFPDTSQRANDWEELKQNIDASLLYTVNGEGIWHYFLSNKYHQNIALLNQAHGSSYKAFNQVPFREKRPTNTQEAIEWETFIRTKWPLRFTRIAPEALASYHQFLEHRYTSIAHYNKTFSQTFKSFNEIAIPTDMHTANASSHLDWRDFFRETIDLKYVECITAERLFRSHLLNQHGNIQRINLALHTSFVHYYDIKPPWIQADWHDVLTNRASYKGYFLFRNYREVIEYIFVHGRSLMVTFIFLTTVLVAQLIINPLCAYALSRFKLRHADKIILFLLVTMAFPIEVTMIPNFITMRYFGLLNSYWALILPAIANGYFIFILKGYFDTIPIDLYEAADLDGASEKDIYFKIITPLSHPILAWMTLRSFMIAYGAFMFAMILCQDSKMWTLMVWIYEMQNWAPPYLISAALIIAAVPSIIVFIICQRIIMRDTGLPTTF